MTVTHAIPVDRRPAGRSLTRAFTLALVASLVLTLSSAPANAGLVATHRISSGATIGDTMGCTGRITTVSYFGGGSPTSIWYDRLEVRNGTGSLTLFSGYIKADSQLGGKRFNLPGWSSGPAYSVKTIPIKQLFPYSRNYGFTLTLRTTTYSSSCQTREDSVRFLSY